MSAIHTLTSRKPGHNVSSAQHFRESTPGQREVSLLEAMDSLPNSGEAADFDIEPIDVRLGFQWFTTDR